MRLAETWRVGSADGGGPETFGSIVALDVDALGRLLVLDGMAGELRLFAADGQHVRTFGRSGEGPGELAVPAGMDRGPDGRLWILDVRNNRFTVYDTAGTFVADVPRPAAGFSRPWLGGFDDEGRLLDATFRTTDDGNELVLVRMQTGKADDLPFVVPRDTFPLWRPPADRFTVYETDASGRRRGVSVAIPFAAGLHRELTPDGRLWTAWTGEYRLARTTIDGDTLLTVTRPHERRPVSEAQLDSALAVLAERTSPDLEYDVERIPGLWPALDSFFEDEDGRLWVRPIAVDGDVGFDVFDRHGSHVGRVRTDPHIVSSPEPVVRGDTIWAVFRDELGVERVIRARLVPGRSGVSPEASTR